MMTREEVKSLYIDCVDKVIGTCFDVNEITEDTDLIDDIGFDSLDKVQAIGYFENKVGYIFKYDEVENFNRVGDIVDFLYKNREKYATGIDKAD